MTARALLRAFFNHHATSRAFYHIFGRLGIWLRKFPAAMRADNSPGLYRFLAIWAFDIAGVFFRVSKDIRKISKAIYYL
jgi:hypothetical protein